MGEEMEEVVSENDHPSTDFTAGEKIQWTPSEVIARIEELRRGLKPMSHDEFWEMKREGRQHSCDKYYEEKWREKIKEAKE